MPFCTWLLIGYFKSIPYELEECALIDGASRLQILRRITLPLAVPGLISAGIFAFTLSWNEFIYALAFIQSTDKKTVPVAILTELVTGDVYQWGALMAGSLLGSVPVALIYSFFVEYYVLVDDRSGQGIASLPARTGAQFLRGLRDNREVWLGGQRVTDPAGPPSPAWRRQVDRRRLRPALSIP